MDHQITFSSAAAARYFFNAGGRLKMSFNRYGGSATSRNAEWTSLCAACGSIQMTANDYVKVGGSGTMSNLTHTGYYGLGAATGVENFKQYDNVGSYSSNYIYCWTSGIGASSNGGFPGIWWRTHFVNPWYNAYQNAVDGTIYSSLVVSSPSTSYLTNTWGTPTITLAVSPF